MHARSQDQKPVSVYYEVGLTSNLGYKHSIKEERGGNSLCRIQHAPWHHHISPLLKDGQVLVAAVAESQKRKKYSSLGAKYFFVPVACESLGMFGTAMLSFLKDLGHCLHQTTGGGSQSYQFLLLHLSVAIQRGNSTSV